MRKTAKGTVVAVHPHITEKMRKRDVRGGWGDSESVSDWDCRLVLQYSGFGGHEGEAVASDLEFSPTSYNTSSSN